MHTIVYFYCNFQQDLPITLQHFHTHSHSSINHIRLKAYMCGSSPNKLQNSYLCLETFSVCHKADVLFETEELVNSALRQCNPQIPELPTVTSRYQLS